MIFVVPPWPPPTSVKWRRNRKLLSHFIFEPFHVSAFARYCRHEDSQERPGRHPQRRRHRLARRRRRARRGSWTLPRTAAVRGPRGWAERSLFLLRRNMLRSGGRAPPLRPFPTSTGFATTAASPNTHAPRCFPAPQTPYRTAAGRLDRCPGSARSEQGEVDSRCRPKPLLGSSDLMGQQCVATP